MVYSSALTFSDMLVIQIKINKVMKNLLGFHVCLAFMGIRT